MSKIIGNTVGTPLNPDMFGGHGDISFSDTTPSMNGAGSPGVSEEVSRADHVHPPDTTRMPSIAAFLSHIAIDNTADLLGYDGGAPFKINWLQLLSQIKGSIDVPVKSVNEQTGNVNLTYSDVGADRSGTAASAVGTHNVAIDSHNDIRLLIDGLTARLNALANSDDVDLDQMKEVVAYIKNNKSLIDGITTSKVNVSDIIDNLATNVTDKPLSAAQGVALKALIDGITVPTKLSELSGDSTHRLVTDTEKAAWNAKSNFSGAYGDLTGKPTKVSTFENDKGYVTNDETITIKGVDESGNIHTWTVYGV